MITKIVLARFFSIFAEAFIIFAVPVLVYTSTNSASLTSLAFGLERLARVVSLPLSGWIGHKIHPLRMLYFSDSIRGCVCLLLYFSYPYISPEYIVSLIIPIACILSFFSGAGYVNLEGFVSQTISSDKLPSIYSQLQFVEQFTYIAAPILVSLLTLKFSILQTFIFISIPFIVSTFLWMSIHKVKTTVSAESHDKKSLKYIIAYIAANRDLKKIISLTFLVNIMQGALLSTAVYVITSVFHQPEQGYAQALAMAGIANCLLFFVAPKLIRRFHIRTVGLSAFIIAACGLLVVGVANNFYIYLLGFLLIIGSEGCFNLFSRFYRARLLPADGFSRYLGIVLVLNQLAVPLASFICARFLLLIDYKYIFIVFFLVVVFSFFLINPFRYFTSKD
ncbi:MFS transporter [Pectobacterium versatile]|uniref:MFS transporter n=1 Tax=Pectobacterium versatile TaxID=2488639 RepID=UPI000D611E32|nr:MULTISPECIES: MFS transporter [Pectobacterium]MBQ4775427.1 MFS transporter [Pectobacterium versatile]MCL6372473.1 MFS transporter [Pectobacterium atrosepticum]MCL6387534.1 MFS transporter [Pectobacterium carotovorum subsp. carotovorum]PWD72093.1 MFS transporter [Pectobacterium versatile]RUR95296.1 MFS transporter [Pectobacterium versatile]